MKRISLIVRWAARLLGLVIVVLYVLFTVREGIPSPSDLFYSEQLKYAGVLIMILGTLAAWKWEVVGTFITFAGFIVNWIAAGQYPEPLLGLFPAAGCLYLIAWMLDHEPATVEKPKVKNRKRK